MSRKTAQNAAIATPISPSHFHVDDLANNQAADDDHRRGCLEKLDSELALPQQAHHLGIKKIQGAAEDNRQQSEHETGNAALRSMRHNLPLQAETLTNNVGGLFKNLGKVAAALFLNQDAGDDDAKILDGHAIGHVLKGRLKFQTV